MSRWYMFVGGGVAVVHSSEIHRFKAIRGFVQHHSKDGFDARCLAEPNNQRAPAPSRLASGH